MNPENKKTKDYIFKKLRNNIFFKKMDEEELLYIVNVAVEKTAEAGTIIFKEGELSRESYFILAGSVEVLKSDRKGVNYRMNVLFPGEVFGQLSIIDAGPRSTTVKALEHVVMLSIPLETLATLSVKKRDLYTKLIRNLAEDLTWRLRFANEITVQTLKNELHESDTRNLMGTFFIFLTMLLSVYSMINTVLYDLMKNSSVSTVVSAPLILSYGACMWYLMKKSKYPMSFFGLTMKNWKKNIIESLWWSAIFMAVLLAAKMIYIYMHPSLSNEPIIGFSEDLVLKDSAVKQPGLLMVIMGAVVYIVSCPIQEIAARGCIQSSLQKFLTGRKSTFWAIILTNVVFATTHTYIHRSQIFLFVIFLCGILWSMMYARQKSLLGPTISHIVIGLFGFFCIGFRILDN